MFYKDLSPISKLMLIKVIQRKKENKVSRTTSSEWKTDEQGKKYRIVVEYIGGRYVQIKEYMPTLHRADSSDTEQPDM